MKRYFAVILAVLAVFAVSCNKNEENEWTKSERSPVSLESELSELDVLSNTIVYKTDGENVLDADYFAYYFGDEELLDGIEEYIYYTSATSTVSEVGVFKVKDEKTAQSLLSAFKARGENLEAIYENYSPADVAVAKGMQTGSFDDIVWFSATTDNDSVTAVVTE